MAKRKTNAKKGTAQKQRGRKPATRKAKAIARKPAKKAAPESEFDPSAFLDGSRRPPQNPIIPDLMLQYLGIEQRKIRGILEEYAEHLRSLDRRRLNGVGLKHQGFIDRTLELTSENPEFLPHYLTLAKFQSDYNYFVKIRGMYDVARQIQELLWNITIISSDILYTDALEFYASVREAAQRRVDAAESIYNTLEVFFRRHTPTGEDGEPVETEKKEIHDAIAYIHGKRDGKFMVENISPKVQGGVHKVIDERLADRESYNEKVEGEIKE